MTAALLLIAVAFAFPDEQGARLLATSDIANPQILRVALCSGAPQPVAIEFDHAQTEGRGSTGRQAPQNFAQTAGAVFRIVSGTVAAGATCVLADESFTAGAALVPLKRPPQNARCSRAEYPQIQAEKQRAVVGCWPIAEGETGIHVSILEFSRYLTRALASLVVVDADRRMYIDYPADFKGPGADMWRADDGGEIHAEGFDVVFLLKRGTTYVLGVDWSAAEGHALSVHAAEDGGQFKELMTDSWYRSPM
jgi:hypothetical protein